jgi:hypothetical protein
MSQNDNNQDDASSTADNGAKVTEDDLRQLKYGNEDVDGSDKDDQDETSDSDNDGDDADEAGNDDGKTGTDSEDDDSDDDSKDGSDDDDSEFVKEFPNIKGDTLVDYARNLEATISSSNTEGKRLADENATLKQRIATMEAGKGSADADDSKDTEVLTPELAYIRQKQDEEIGEAFAEFRKSFPQVEDLAEYNKFVKEVKVLGQAIHTSQNRFASPKELYSKAAVMLGWEADKVDGKDRLKVALKERIAVSTSNSATKKGSKSKVTDAMIRVNRRMYPNKTDEEIRKELEPYVK